MPETVTDNNFSEFIQNKVVLVDVFTTWCGPCKMLGPIIEDVSNHYENDETVSIGKMNGEENRETITQLQVRNVPTIIFYKDGQEVERKVGVVQKSELINIIDNLKD